MSGARALRGGSYRNNAENCRSAPRNDNHPGNRNDNIGFRVVWPAPSPRSDLMEIPSRPASAGAVPPCPARSTRSRRPRGRASGWTILYT